MCLLDISIRESGNNIYKAITPFKKKSLRNCGIYLLFYFVPNRVMEGDPIAEPVLRINCYWYFDHIPPKKMWNNHNMIFRMSGTTIEMTVQKVITIAAPMAKELFAREVNIDNFESYGIARCINYPCSKRNFYANKLIYIPCTIFTYMLYTQY